MVAAQEMELPRPRSSSGTAAGKSLSTTITPSSQSNADNKIIIVTKGIPACATTDDNNNNLNGGTHNYPSKMIPRISPHEFDNIKNNLDDDNDDDNNNTKNILPRHDQASKPLAKKNSIVIPPNSFTPVPLDGSNNFLSNDRIDDNKCTHNITSAFDNTNRTISSENQSAAAVGRRDKFEYSPEGPSELFNNNISKEKAQSPSLRQARKGRSSGASSIDNDNSQNGDDDDDTVLDPASKPIQTRKQRLAPNYSSFRKEFTTGILPHPIWERPTIYGENRKWTLREVAKADFVTNPEAYRCSSPRCELVACVYYESHDRFGRPWTWHGCVDCQEKLLGGWPCSIENREVLRTLTKKDREKLAQYCSTADEVTMPFPTKGDTTVLKVKQVEVNTQELRIHPEEKNVEGRSFGRSKTSSLAPSRKFSCAFVSSKVVPCPTSACSDWALTEVANCSSVQGNAGIQCSTPGCGLVSCVHYKAVVQDKEWYGCLDCQEAAFGGWPSIGVLVDQLKVRYMSCGHKKILLSRCSRRGAVYMPDFSQTENPRLSLFHPFLARVRHRLPQFPGITSCPNRSMELRYPGKEPSLIPRNFHNWKLVEIATIEYLSSGADDLVSCCVKNCDLSACCHYISEDQQEWYSCFDCKLHDRGESTAVETFPFPKQCSKHMKLILKHCSNGGYESSMKVETAKSTKLSKMPAPVVFLPGGSSIPTGFFSIPDKALKWRLTEIASRAYIRRPCAEECLTAGCALKACCHFKAENSSRECIVCLDCMFSIFGGWPDPQVLHGLGVERMSDTLKNYLLHFSSKKVMSDMPNFISTSAPNSPFKRFRLPERDDAVFRSHRRKALDEDTQVNTSAMTAGRKTLKQAELRAPRLARTSLSSKQITDVRCKRKRGLITEPDETQPRKQRLSNPSRNFTRWRGNSTEHSKENRICAPKPGSIVDSEADLSPPTSSVATQTSKYSPMKRGGKPQSRQPSISSCSSNGGRKGLAVRFADAVDFSVHKIRKPPKHLTNGDKETNAPKPEQTFRAGQFGFHSCNFRFGGGSLAQPTLQRCDAPINCPAHEKGSKRKSSYSPTFTQFFLPVNDTIPTANRLCEADQRRTPAEPSLSDASGERRLVTPDMFSETEWSQDSSVSYDSASCSSLASQGWGNESCSRSPDVLRPIPLTIMPVIDQDVADLINRVLCGDADTRTRGIA